MAERYDLVILGGGPAGYPAAIRARQLGMSVALIEADNLGGTCLNVGCIPTKALIHASRVYSEIGNFKRMGLSAESSSHDYSKVSSYKTRIVKKLVAGTKLLVTSNGASLISGRGVLEDASSIRVNDDLIGFDRLLVAVGSRVLRIPMFPLDGEKIISSDDAINLKELPGRIGIVGAGAIGMEFAGIFRSFGSEVTLIELMDRPLPLEDVEVGDTMSEIYTRRGIRLATGYTTESCVVENDLVILKGNMNGQEENFEFDLLLVSIGREASTSGCGFEEAGVALEKGYISVDGNQQTNISNIYAAGDCCRPPLLAHKATAEGIRAVEFMAGKEPPELNLDNIPRVTYTWPEVASVGINEGTAKTRGIDYRVARFSLQGIGKALIDGSQEGFAKAVVDVRTGIIMGITIVGPNASELSAAALLTVTGKLTGEELSHRIFAHPTVSESLGELGHALGDGAIHMPPE